MTKHVSALQFSEKLRSLRLGAAILYDRGKAAGQSELELAEDMKPLMQVLVKTIDDATHHDFAGVCEAILGLRSEIEMHYADMVRLKRKGDDAQVHIDSLERAIKAHLKKHELDTKMDRGYSVTLTMLDGKEELTIR